MDQSPASNLDAGSSREEIAKRLVSDLLRGDKSRIVEAQELVAAGDVETGPWLKSLSNLLQQSSRVEELETAFEETLLREKLSAMRELAYGASHEINNPLANISSRAQTLLRDETDPERRRKLATINGQAFRAFEMIADMMLFAKPPDLNLQMVNVADVVAEVMQELTGQADEQGTALVASGTNDDCWLNADATHLAVALKALCRNSLEAIASGGQVTITLDAGDDFVELRVVDTGPGIPDEVREHLFDPFYSGREAGRGLGFGLSKCWRIVQLHGGTIKVSGSELERTCFWIRLPRSIEAAPPLVA